MAKTLTIRRFGRLITVQRRSLNRNHVPTKYSLKRAVRLLLKWGNKIKKFHVTSTTGGWENFDTSFSYNPRPVHVYCAPDPGYLPE